MKDRVLIIGSGGREHALAWKIAKSNMVEAVYVAPGNDGMNTCSNIKTKNITENDFEGIDQFAKDNRISLIFIGPEKPLSRGIVDYLEKKGHLVIGPSKQAAQLESSKVFAKKFMQENDIPTARFAYYHQYEEALAALNHFDIEKDGIVIKADELASGKGVVVTHNRNEARKTLYDFMMNPDCSVNTKKILLEEKLDGKEVSFFALCDGDNFVSLGHACDYKRVYDGNLGPNTGGMGGHTPSEFPGNDLILEIEQKVFEKTLKGMRNMGIPFRGILFAGLMIKNDHFHVLEYNVRFGDPEAQILMPVISEDIYPLLKRCSNRDLGSNYYYKGNKQKSVHVVLTSGGYPNNFNEPMKLNEPITIPPHLLNHPEIHLFFSGVKKSQDKLVNSGGRVLGITCTGPDVLTARNNCYQNIEQISFHHAHWRKDIALN